MAALGCQNGQLPDAVEMFLGVRILLSVSLLLKHPHSKTSEENSKYGENYVHEDRHFKT